MDGNSCPLSETQKMKEQLLAEIERQNLSLNVMTLQDLGRMLIGDFDRFEKMSDYYAPVMLLVAVIIVLVNAITLTIARRKELALLRILGFSIYEIQVMFVLECFITSLIGGFIGTFIAIVMALGYTSSISVSWYPFAITMVTTTVIGGISSLVLSKGNLASTLRNPMGE